MLYNWYKKYIGHLLGKKRHFWNVCLFSDVLDTCEISRQTIFEKFVVHLK